MKINWKIIFDVFYTLFFVFIILTLVILSFFLGLRSGEILGFKKAQEEFALLSEKASSKEITRPTSMPGTTSTPDPLRITPPRPKVYNWTGPQLWEAVNKARVDHGVNPLKQADELCTIASIRLNELLELGKLDGHEGFSNLPERRPDLKWIFEKYNISEFLIAGSTSAQDAVDAWLGTLGHKKLITGGEYVWGCTYAQGGFGVAIAAYQ
jgi:uncharacterized protein YkwD